MTPPNNRVADHAGLDDIKQDLAELRSDMTDMLAGFAASGRDEAGRRLQDARDRACELGERGKQRAGEAHEKVGDIVSERPITALAVAFGAGAIAARLLKR